jgi:hypothetical protein
VAIRRQTLSLANIFSILALLIERLVVRQRDFPAFGRRDAGLAAFLAQGSPEPIAVIAAIGKKRFGGRQDIKDQPCALVIAHLPFAEQQDEGLALAVADSVHMARAAKAARPSAARANALCM